MGVQNKMVLKKAERPEQLSGSTFRRETGCGNLYIAVNGNGRPLEVFATLGKAGGCSHAQNEALTRAISLGLRYGVPVEEFIDELEGLKCPSPVTYPADRETLSCADGIAKALREFHLESPQNKEEV